MDQEKKVAEVLDQKTPFSEDVKRQIKRARKPTMRTVAHYLCDGCDTEIIKPEDGFIIHGNIYVADPKCCGGLVGNNFPNKESFVADEVKQSVLCRMCFCKALGLLDKKGGKAKKSSYEQERLSYAVGNPSNNIREALRLASVGESPAGGTTGWSGWHREEDILPDLFPDSAVEEVTRRQEEDIPF